MESSDRSRPTFSEACLSSITFLTHLRDQAGEDPGNCSLQLAIEDAIGRFQVWAGNIGALQPKSSQKSLEFRLRDAPDIRANIHAALGRLSEVADRALKITNSQLPNRQDDWSHEDSGLTDVAIDPTDELHELSQSIKSSINTLFRLSMLVRRHRPRGRIGPAEDDDGQPPPEDPMDTRHVRDLLPCVNAKPWLAVRLGKAISKRREYIKYREKHRKSLAKVVAADVPGVVTDTGTIATTFVDGEQPRDDQTPAPARSTQTSATSFFSFADEESGPTVPELSDMVLDGVKLDYGEPFECPLCRTIQNVANRLEWKKHVFFDLQPYVCTFEDCSYASELFATRHEWWEHEIDTHRRKWRCSMCATGSVFQKKTDIEAHIRSKHADEIADAQLPFVVKMCHDPIDVDLSACPLCTDWTPDEGDWSGGKGLTGHLARHMQHLALASVPMHIEGLIINLPGEDLYPRNYHDSDYSIATSWQHTIRRDTNTSSTGSDSAFRLSLENVKTLGKMTERISNAAKAPEDTEESVFGRMRNAFGIRRRVRAPVDPVPLSPIDWEAQPYLGSLHQSEGELPDIIPGRVDTGEWPRKPIRGTRVHQFGNRDGERTRSPTSEHIDVGKREESAWAKLRRRMGSVRPDELDDNVFKHGGALDYPDIPGEEFRNPGSIADLESPQSFAAGRPSQPAPRKPLPASFFGSNRLPSEAGTIGPGIYHTDTDEYASWGARLERSSRVKDGPVEGTSSDIEHQEGGPSQIPQETDVGRVETMDKSSKVGQELGTATAGKFDDIEFKPRSASPAPRTPSPISVMDINRLSQLLQRQAQRQASTGKISPYAFEPISPSRSRTSWASDEAVHGPLTESGAP
ncbi:hypothetical protein B0H66DRAFT_502485 [Apodospora peruviana]|uniref:C2H2-type domain-containing protein n=1 Tax=Apodospora peruviana TaxID=516989 RepID=A0AAE0HZ18_9PEZI|nr:hypothetical protein B0H66DRAFT_502485 [Apodospora peruviana]